ncbi:DNA-3-methyladenine glycosylase 2 family protein [Streptomyces dysideae]|uniref:DNA-3-methyladenine glycosylase 2 family protein n=1 Tax=Streptomyces dysideae TaxID=909626 RepID=UPI00099EF381|nr:DNA-3-methyladenine glycosylase 2 family protein [Streptomyces dysideae]
MTDEDTRYEAVRSRDARFDGEFFFAVETTGIYCRPSCPAVTPKRRNVRFFATAAAAQGSGFRACRRCRPDAVPGSAEWNVRADVVGRAMRLIGDGIVDREGVVGLATRLGYSARQLQRQLTAELGAGPVALARSQRAHTARVLLQTTELPITEIAFASGFASVRQFNDTIRTVYDRTPSELRGAHAAHRRTAVTPAAGIPLRLAYRGPYHAAAVFDLLEHEAVPGIEAMTGSPGHRTYRRTLRLPHGTGIVAVDERPGTPQPRPGAHTSARPARKPPPGTALTSRGGAHPEADPPAATTTPGDAHPAAEVSPGAAHPDAGSGTSEVPPGVAQSAAASGIPNASPGAARPDAASGTLEPPPSDLHPDTASGIPNASPGAARPDAASGTLEPPPSDLHPDTASGVPNASPGAARPAIPGTSEPSPGSTHPTPGPRAPRTPTPPAPTHPGGWLNARLRLTDPRDLTTAVQRLRRLFDLDADPYAVDERLGADPGLAPLVAARPGLRSPGAADPEELAVRALVGRGVAEGLVRRYGKALDAPCGSLTHLFPEPAVLAEAEPDGPLGSLTAALADGAVRLDAGADRDDAQDALLALPGLDARTVAVIRTRALGDPDVAPPGAGVPDSWRPWRSYAVQHLRIAGELE